MSINKSSESKCIENLEEILEEDEFLKVLKNALMCVNFTMRNIYITAIAIFILLPVIILIGTSEDTIARFSDVVEISNNMALTIFGITFTGYAIFQAFLNPELVEKLLSTMGKKKSLFHEYNLFFFYLSVRFIFIITLNYLLRIILNNIPEYYFIPIFSNTVNNTLSIVLIIFYLSYNIELLTEITSFLFNIYQVFNFKALNDVINNLEKK